MDFVVISVCESDGWHGWVRVMVAFEVMHWLRHAAEKLGV